LMPDDREVENGEATIAQPDLSALRCGIAQQDRTRIIRTAMS
jgi:hypothetical protein